MERFRVPMIMCVPEPTLLCLRCQVILQEHSNGSLQLPRQPQDLVILAVLQLVLILQQIYPLKHITELLLQVVRALLRIVEWILF